MSLEEERKWIELSKKEIRNFQPIYERYHGVIYRFIFRRTDDEILTGDLCSQTFYKAMIKIKGYQWQGKPIVAWLYRIALNEVRRHYRDRKPVFLIEEDKIVASPDLRDEWELATKECLTELLGTLKEGDLQVLELKYFEGHTFKEISTILGVKESTIKMKVYRLLSKLKETLSERYV
ncbi:MAG: sigma-70 family RNA polymerase sigma factor [Cyclobacteriaceae bacterium]